MPRYREEFAKDLPRVVVHIDATLQPHLMRRWLQKADELDEFEIIRSPRGRTVLPVRPGEAAFLEKICADRVDLRFPRPLP